jgi:hypothetical protein
LQQRAGQRGASAATKGCRPVGRGRRVCERYCSWTVAGVVERQSSQLSGSGARQPTIDLPSRESRSSCCPIRHQPWSGRPALPWQCSRTRRAATLGHAITRPAISVFRASPLLFAHRGGTPGEAMRIRRSLDETRNTARLRCTGTVCRNSSQLSMRNGTSNAVVELLEDHVCTSMCSRLQKLSDGTT